MWLDQLSISGLRNIASQTLAFSPGLNVIIGDNGSGKTSLLEAIYLLSCAKSFRTPQLNRVKNHTGDGFRLFARIFNPQADELIPVGVEYKAGRMLIKVAGQVLRRSSDLATRIPVVVIHQESLRLLTHNVSYRKKFLDWGVFHVEQDYISHWRRYSRGLKQRNLALQQRNGSKGSESIWDKELILSAHQLDQARKRYISEFTPYFIDYLRQMLVADYTTTVEYYRGWAADIDYGEVLQVGLSRDRQVGYTMAGPHRADLLVRMNKVQVQDIASRGQLKQIVLAMYMAQVAVFNQRMGKGCLILLDDITAELDDRHIAMTLSVFERMGCQVITTSTELGRLQGHCKKGGKVFHVERGLFEEVIQYAAIKTMDVI
ncbi:MAG: DNA replication/repair protein RecF [Gammaproteobacteria bacterium]|nr:DNA replication/repair protein RecF [Gammaproteobacteria bacterium]